MPKPELATCVYRQEIVTVDGRQPFIVAGLGGRFSNDLCVLQARDGSFAPFCKAPTETEKTCPIARFFDGKISYESAERELTKLHQSTPKP